MGTKGRTLRLILLQGITEMNFPGAGSREPRFVYENAGKYVRFRFGMLETASILPPHAPKAVFPILSSSAALTLLVHRCWMPVPRVQ